MGRAERRRLEKQKGKQVKTYNLTRSQLHNAVRQVTEEDLKRIKQEAMEDAINTAMTLLLVLPMEVLMDHYWKKTYKNSKAWCPYSSMEKVLENWRLL